MKEAIKYLKSYLKKNDTAVIACSGGPDSMTLLNILNDLKEEYNLNLICAHVNHKLRKQSEEEEDYVKSYCKKNNIKFELLTIKEYDKTNFHNQARDKRYEFFEKLIKKNNANCLMTAHHADDLIETILMRISRGSNLRGYSGFLVKSRKMNYDLIRPLSYNTKEDILEYCKKNNLKYYIDHTNNEDHYTRNRYRHNILKFLKEEDKNIHKKYLKFREELNEYDEFINNIVYEELLGMYGNYLYLDRFDKLDKLIQKKMIEEILYINYKEDINLLNDKHVEEILKLIRGNKPNGSIDLPLNNVLFKSYNRLYIKEKMAQKEYDKELMQYEILPNDSVIERIEKSEETSNYFTRISFSDVKLPLRIRSRKDGDKIAVKNMNGTKKIKEIFIEEKISMEKRKLWPIVTDSDGKIIWLPGLKKSKFDKDLDEKYDIILRYICEGEIK